MVAARRCLPSWRSCHFRLYLQGRKKHTRNTIYYTIISVILCLISRKSTPKSSKVLSLHLFSPFQSAPKHPKSFLPISTLLSPPTASSMPISADPPASRASHTGDWYIDTYGSMHSLDILMYVYHIPFYWGLIPEKSTHFSFSITRIHAPAVSEKCTLSHALNPLNVKKKSRAACGKNSFGQLHISSYAV